jgi:hypothetical protein
MKSFYRETLKDSKLNKQYHVKLTELMRQHNQGRNRQTSCPSYQSVYRQCAVVVCLSACSSETVKEYVQRLLGCSLEGLETDAALRCLGRLFISCASCTHGDERRAYSIGF